MQLKHVNNQAAYLYRSPTESWWNTSL